MTLKEQIKSDFLEAYKSKDMVKKNFLSLLTSAIQKNETSDKPIPSTDENVIKLVRSFEKSINTMIEANTKLGIDSSEQKTELGYLQPYFPKLMTEQEILVIVKDIISRNGKVSVGFVMGAFNKENNGKYFDNKLVSTIINKELSC